MDYVFHFGDIWAARDELISGTLLTLRLSALSMILSLIVAVAGAFARAPPVPHGCAPSSRPMSN